VIEYKQGFQGGGIGKKRQYQNYFLKQGGKIIAK
jgi:hypothetical protein